jgi:hypothetical protein
MLECKILNRPLPRPRFAELPALVAIPSSLFRTRAAVHLENLAFLHPRNDRTDYERTARGEF